MPRASRLLLVCLAASACTFDPTVSADAHINCAGDSDCPATHRCIASAGYCVAKNPPESVPPSLDAHAVSPGSGNRSTVFQLQFRVTEALATDPSLRLIGSDGQELTGAARDTSSALGPLEYRYTWQVADAQGGPAPVEGQVLVIVDLIDTVGNLAERVLVGSFTLDFTAPEVVAQTADIALTAPAGSLISTVEAVTVGTTVDVQLSTTEPLQNLSLVSTRPELVLTPVQTAGTAYRFRGQLTANPPAIDELVQLDLHGQDLAGNELQNTRLILQPALRVDTIGPTLPDAGITYVRKPWGDVNPAADFLLEAPAGTLEPQLWVLSRDVGGNQPMLAARAELDGALTAVSIGRTDRPTVEVALVDEAGNSTGFSSVRRVRLLATITGKVLGQPAPNPNRLELRPTDSPGRVMPTAEAAAPSTVSSTHVWHRRTALPGPTCAALATDARSGGVTAVSSSQTQQWVEEDWRAPSPSLSCDGGMSAAWDELRDRLDVLCQRSIFVDMWELDRSGAVQSAQTMSYYLPMGLAYWPQRGRVVAVTPGGNVGVWDGLRWTFDVGYLSGFLVAAFVPDRDGTLLAVDAAGRRARYGDAGWLMLDPDAGAMPPGGLLRMAAEPFTAEPLLYVVAPDGGLSVQRQGPAGWTPVAALPAAVTPGCRPTVASDPAYSRTLVVDGSGRTFGLLADAGWSVVSASLDGGSSPGLLMRHAAAWSSALQRTVVFTPTGEVASWDGVEWRAEVGGPPSRINASMGEDPGRGALVLFGGEGSLAGPALQDTWTFDGTAWGQLAGASPPARSGAAMTWCPPLAATLLHGGRSGVGTVLDPPAGQFLDDAWLLPSDGGPWALRTNTGNARAYHSGFFDQDSGVCELTTGRGALTAYDFGRIKMPGDDGGLWSSLDSWVGFALIGAGAGDARGRYVGFSGPVVAGTNTLQTDVFELVGKNVTPIVTVATDEGQPLPRMEQSMSLDGARGRLVMVGGRTSTAAAAGTDEVWELQTVGQRPAVAFFLDLSAVGAPAATPVRLTLDAIGGFQSSAGGAFDVQAFHQGRWESFSPSDAGVPGRALLVIEDAQVLGEMFRGRPELGLALRPAGVTADKGPALAKVTWVQASLEYLLP